MLFHGRRFADNTKILKPVRASAGIESMYRRRLDAMIKEMNASVVYWLTAAYKANEPRIAQDAIPADALQTAVNKLRRRWEKNFENAADALADYFALDVSERSDAMLRRILKEGGWTIKFKMTPAMNDIFAATVNQNVALIKSIPAQYLSDVEGLVQRSVQRGGDLHQLTRDLQARYEITRRRAEIIARDQNIKATSAFNRARQLEIGIKEAIWMHSHGGKIPRPTHVAMNGKKYNIAKGMYDSAEKKFIQPGELINCRCTSRPVVPGFT